MRQIDCVTVKGSNQPLGLFCYDLDMEAARAAIRALAETHRAEQAALIDVDMSGQHYGASATCRAPSGSARGSAVMSPPLRHSLAALPGAAGAARSSVVVSGGHTGRGDDEGGADVDEAEVSGTAD